MIKDLSESKTQFEKELESYYQMIINGINQVPEPSFFARGGTHFASLTAEQKQQYKEVKENTTKMIKRPRFRKVRYPE